MQQTKRISEITLPEETELNLRTMFIARRVLSNHYIEKGRVKIDYKFVNLDDPNHQQYIRDEMGFLTEEIFEAYELVSPIMITDAVHEEHADVLHFWLEILLYSGIDEFYLAVYVEKLYKEFNLGWDNDSDNQFAKLFQFLRIRAINQGITIREYPKVKLLLENEDDYIKSVLNSLKDLNRARNQLKNKYWKTTQTKTNVEKYQELLVEGFLHYLMSLVILGYREKDVVADYLKKNIINIERVNGTTW